MGQRCVVRLDGEIKWMCVFLTQVLWACNCSLMLVPAEGMFVISLDWAQIEV